MLEHQIYDGMVFTFQKELSYSRSPVSEHLEYLLSTPQIIEVIIEAAYRMLDPLLPEPYITVGRKIEFTHEQPTLVMDGRPIKVELKVDKVEGHFITLDVACFDGIGQIGSGKYDRTIVDRERLRFSTMDRAEKVVL